MRFTQARKDFQTAASGHVQVEQQDIASGRAQHFTQLGVAPRFARDLDVWRIGQRVAYSAPQDGVVAELLYAPGDQVTEGAELLKLSAA